MISLKRTWRHIKLNVIERQAIHNNPLKLKVKHKLSISDRTPAPSVLMQQD